MKTPQNYLQQPYARIVIPVENNNGYHAEILEFPGCFAQGKTPQEAYWNLEKAAESWIEVTLAHGQQIPEPSSNLTYSGNISLRLPRTIHRQAARFAERDETSLNTYLVSAISAKIGAEDFYTVLTRRIEQHLMATATTIAQAFTSAGTFKLSIGPVTESATTASGSDKLRLPAGKTTQG